MANIAAYVSAGLNFDQLLVDSWGELMLMKCRDLGIAVDDGEYFARVSIELIELGQVPIYG